MVISRFRQVKIVVVGKAASLESVPQSTILSEETVLVEPLTHGLPPCTCSQHISHLKRVLIRECFSG